MAQHTDQPIVVHPYDVLQQQAEDGEWLDFITLRTREDFRELPYVAGRYGGTKAQWRIAHKGRRNGQFTPITTPTRWDGTVDCYGVSALRPA